MKKKKLKDPRPFTLTAAAVKRYDKARARIMGLLETTHATAKDVERYQESLERAGQIVGKCFALDTRELNNPEVAEQMRPDSNNGWLRKLLVDNGHTDCGLTKEIRTQRGWGW